MGDDKGFCYIVVMSQDDNVVFSRLIAFRRLLNRYITGQRGKR